MNVLSLFDGMSCGQIALNRLGIKYDNYYASEINKYAIKVTMKNYPNTIQVGDVTALTEHDLPKIDLMIGGSPCQGFSFCGKQLNFNDPRSKLFFEFARLLQSVRPKWFLLENVSMKKEYQEVISNILGVEPIKINSAVLSAQNRERLYWTNIPVGPIEPKDMNVRSILGELDSKYICKDKREFIHSSNSNGKCGYFEKDSQANRVYFANGKGVTLCGEAGGGAAKMGQYFVDNVIRKLSPVEAERMQTVPDGYTECDGVSDSQRYKMLGNGWTVDVICHILRGINSDNSQK